MKKGREKGRGLVFIFLLVGMLLFFSGFVFSNNFGNRVITGAATRSLSDSSLSSSINNEESKQGNSVFSITGNAISDFFGFTSNFKSIIVNSTSVEFSISPSKEGDLIVAPDYNFDFSPGDPNLPYKVVRVLLPSNYTNLSIKITPSNIQEYYELDVAPTKPLYPLGEDNLINTTVFEPFWGNKTIVNGRNVEIYTSDKFYPENHLYAYIESRLGNFNILTFTYFPYKYNPIQKTLIYSDLSFNISFESLSGNTYPQDVLYQSILKDLVVNYNEYSYARPRVFGIFGGSPTPEGYMIIASKNIIENSTRLSAFIDHKTSKGFTVYLQEANNLSSNWNSMPNYNRSDTIRNFLKTNYSSKNIKYLLLVDVPMKMLADGYQDTPSDYYYADLNIDYTSNSWGVGTPTTYSGFYPEIFVGRIPYYGYIGDFDHILDKIMNYENDSISRDWVKDIMISHPPTADPIGGINGGEQVYTELAPSIGFNVTRMYTAEYKTIPPADYLINVENVTLAWSTVHPGFHFWATHGNSQQAHFVIDSNYTALLDDNYPAFTFQFSCDTGQPDISNNLAYSLLKNGAIETVSATDTLWGYNTDTHGYIYYYSDYLIRDHLTTGEALIKTTNFVAPRFHNFVVFNIYGDPSIKYARIPPSIGLLERNFSEIGNNNGFFERGENLSLVVKIKNIGDAASNTKIKLSSTSNDVISIPNSDVTIGTLNPDQEYINNANPFIVELRDIKYSGDINFKIIVTADNYSQEINFKESVGVKSFLKSQTSQYSLTKLVYDDPYLIYYIDTNLVAYNLNSKINKTIFTGTVRDFDSSLHNLVYSDTSNVKLYSLDSNTSRTLASSPTYNSVSIYNQTVVYANTANPAMIYKYNLTSSQATSIFSNSGYAYYLDLFANNLVFYISPDIYYLDLATGQNKVIGSDTFYGEPKDDLPPAVVSGEKIYYISPNNSTRTAHDDIRMYNLSNSDSSIAIGDTDYDKGCLSLYGNFLVFCDWKNYHLDYKSFQDLYLYDLDKKTTTPLFVNLGYQTKPLITKNNLFWWDSKDSSLVSGYGSPISPFYNLYSLNLGALNTCGNNILESYEECDDGNRILRDGCDTSCLEEDMTPPSQVNNLQRVSNNKRWIFVNWSVPTDNDFNNSLVYINGANIANTTNNYFNFTNLSSGVVYTISVGTRDIYGNINNSLVTILASTIDDLYGLQVALNFDNNLNDSSENNFKVDVAGGNVSYVPGVFGEAINLSGPVSLSITDNGYLNGWNEFNISFYLKRYNVSLDSFPLRKYSTTYEYYIRLGGSSAQAWIYNATKGVQGVNWNIGSLADTNWHKYDFVYNGSDFKLVIDNILVTSGKVIGPIAPYKKSLLLDLEGEMDELVIYSKYSPVMGNGSVPVNNTINDTIAPASVTNLRNVSSGTSWIYFNWSNPSDADFSENIIYLNNVNVANVSVNYYNASGLNAGTSYTIKIYTKDTFGNINNTNVSLSARTLDEACISNFTNTTWSNWINLTCSSNQRNQTRNLTQYDYNNCNLTNITFFSYQLVGPTYLNTSWSQWINLTCLANDKMNQTRNLTQYDLYFCASNQTFVEYQATANCNYCTPNLVNTTQTQWINQSCSLGRMNQSSYKIQYDSNNCNKTINQTFYFYQSVGPNYRNTTQSNWINQSCLFSNLMNQSSYIIQYDDYACVANTTFNFYRQNLSCDFCTPGWKEINTSCLINDVKIGWFNDSNGCFVKTGLASDNNRPINNTYSCNYCNQNIIGPINTSCNLSYKLTQYYYDSNYSTCCALTGLSNDCQINNGSYLNKTLSCGSCQISLVNATTLWKNLTCLSNSYMNQTRNLSEYDSNHCGTYINQSFVEYQSFMPCDYDGKPLSINNLNNVSQGADWVYFNWSNPNQGDFNSSLIYINGINMGNISDNYYNFTGVEANIIYTLIIYTKDNFGNVNLSGVAKQFIISTYAPIKFYINWSEWDILETTNFTQYEENYFINLSNVVFSNSYGKINFINNISLNKSINFINNIKITQNKVFVYSSIIPEFNKSADLIFKNINLSRPVIKKDGIICPESECANISYNSSNNSLSFRITSFVIAPLVEKSSGFWLFKIFSSITGNAVNDRKSSITGNAVYEVVDGCFDEVMDGDETGVDCGGSCSACIAGDSGIGPGSGGGGGGGGGGSSGGGTKLNTINQSLNKTAPSFFERLFNPERRDINNSDNATSIVGDITISRSAGLGLIFAILIISLIIVILVVYLIISHRREHKLREFSS